jgi:glycine cleavage system aminomethyltransferase T
LQSDLNIACLPNELLLDFEPGLTEMISQRLEKYIIADDAQVVDAGPPYGLISAQGPMSESVIRKLGLPLEIPSQPMSFTSVADATLGEIYLMNQPRLGSSGFDLFVPTPALGAVFDKLIAAAREAGGRACGWQAFEAARIGEQPRAGSGHRGARDQLRKGLLHRAGSHRAGADVRAGGEIVAWIALGGRPERIAEAWR